MSKHLLFALGAFAVLRAAVGCSDSDDSDNPNSNTGASSSSDAASSTEASSSSSASSSGAGGGAGDGGAGGGATGGAGGGTAGGGGTGGTCDYSSPNTCETAEVLTEMAGDEGAPIVTVTGQTSKYFQIKMLEKSNLPGTVKYKVSLTTPQGMNYDLFVRRGDGDAPNCNIAPDKGTGMPATVADFFADSVVSDDSAWISIEVAYVNGMACGMDAEWTLTVQGNAQ